jgi:hypothetical protein
MSNKITYKQSKIAEHFGIDTSRKSVKGWFYNIECPWCGNNDKFGIKFNEKSKEYRNEISFNCFHGSCKESGSEFKLLEKIGKGHLFKHGEFITETDKVTSVIVKQSDHNDPIITQTLVRPLGFRRVQEDPYLKDRGFEPWQYDQYHIGRTKLDRKLLNYVLFCVIEGGEYKGYVGRLTWSPQQIEQYEQTSGNKVNKYQNEGGADFGKLLFGIDEITKDTKRVILVEGITDKANVDRQLNLNLCGDLKCLCTFGKKISDFQLQKLLQTGVQEVVLLYDPDAVNDSKKYSFLLESCNLKVKVGYLSDKDPGDLTFAELIKVLSETQTANQFSINKVQKQKLK